MAVAEIRLKKWTREEWHRLIDLGVFGEDDRYELLDGDIVEMGRQSPLHAGTVRIAAMALRAAFGEGFVFSEHSPISPERDERSEPEPDISVARGSVRDFLREHPAWPDLVVEVAVSTLHKDRGLKASLYARAGYPEYWIVIPNKRTVEVYRNPIHDGRGRCGGWSYGSITVLRKGDAIAPLALSGIEIPVADLLP